MVLSGKCDRGRNATNALLGRGAVPSLDRLLSARLLPASLSRCTRAVVALRKQREAMLS